MCEHELLCYISGCQKMHVGKKTNKKNRAIWCECVNIKTNSMHFKILFYSLPKESTLVPQNVRPLCHVLPSLCQISLDGSNKDVSI